MLRSVRSNSNAVKSLRLSTTRVQLQTVLHLHHLAYNRLPVSQRSGFGYRTRHPEVLSPYLWSFFVIVLSRYGIVPVQDIYHFAGCDLLRCLRMALDVARGLGSAVRQSASDFIARLA